MRTYQIKICEEIINGLERNCMTAFVEDVIIRAQRAHGRQVRRSRNLEEQACAYIIKFPGTSTTISTAQEPEARPENMENPSLRDWA